MPGVPRAEQHKVQVAGVGYRNLRDLSLGPVLLDSLAQDLWPLWIEIEDLSYGPIAVLYHLDEHGPYDRMVLVAGVKRQRQPGGIYCYRWGHCLPDPDEIQARMAETLMGVISLDNLLIIATYFGKLPQDVIIIEVEAADDGWGEGLTPQVEAVIPAVIAVIRDHAMGEAHVLQKPAHRVRPPRSGATPRRSGD